MIQEETLVPGQYPMCSICRFYCARWALRGQCASASCTSQEKP